MLVQTPDALNVQAAELRVVTKKKPTPQQLADLLFAWRVAKFVKSNAIVFCKDGMTLGVGAGQMSRVDSARIASIKAENAGLSLKGSVVASDAFFPVPRRPGRRGESRCDRHHPARRQRARRRSDRSRRRTRHRHGVHWRTAFPALMLILSIPNPGSLPPS